MGYLYTQIARFWETAVLGVGEHLAMSVGGIFFFGFPVVFSLGAYIFAILAVTGTSFWIAIPSALAGSLVIGFLFALMYRKLSNDSFAVFTLASVMAFDALVRSWDSLTGGVLGIAGVPKPSFISNLLTLIVLQGIVAVTFLILEYFILKSPFGRSLQAHKESKTFLNSLGRNADAVGSLIVILASLASAVAGIIAIWRIQFLDPTFGGIPILLQILTISILAVKPKVRWIAVSTLIIVILPEVLRFFPFPSSIVGHLRLLFYSGLLIILVNRLSSGYTSQKRFV